MIVIHRPIAAFTFIVIALAALLPLGHAQAADDISLSVSPTLCITDSPEKTCDMALEFYWKSDTPGHYCLIEDKSHTALQCWQEDSEGHWQSEQTVSDREVFVISEDGQVAPLAQVEIQVLTTYSEDRRRNRRRKHVWSLM